MNERDDEATSASGASKRAGLRPAIEAMIAPPGGLLRRAPGRARAGARPRRGRRRRGRRRAARARRDRARRGHQPAGAARCERGREARDSPPCAPTPGSRNGVAASARACARGARERSRRRPRRRRRAARPGSPSSATMRASRSHSGRRASSRSCRSAAPGFEVRTSTKTPAPRRARGVEQRRERVAAEQRVGGEGVGAEALDVAERRRRPPTSAWA